jgi:hypothetical protein
MVVLRIKKRKRGALRGIYERVLVSPSLGIFLTGKELSVKGPSLEIGRSLSKDRVKAQPGEQTNRFDYP